jgi:hypothetical protein
MGNGGGSVGPGRPTPYVPSAVLLVRRRAVGRGFDAELQIGEDVDLVWRLAKAGWRVLYAPDTHVWHDHRVRLGAFVARRRVYASSVAPLARRHPAALPAARFNVRMILPWTLSILGHRRSAFVVAAGGYLSFGHKLTRVTTCRPYLLAGTLFSRGLLATGLALAHATRRAWAPALVLVSMRSLRVRRLLLVAFAVPIVQDAASAHRAQTIPGDALMRFVDEIVAGLGTWEGCLRYRTIRPLLPSWHTSR